MSASEIKVAARPLVSARWLLLAAVLISLIIDLTPRFHMGDSGSYIVTHWGGYLPDDRSWTYGLVLGWVTRTTGRLIAMPLLQILLSWAAFAYFATALAKSLGLQRRVALVIVAVGCLEPLGYYWSRAFMSDSLAQSTFVFLCGVLLQRGRMALRFGLVFLAGVNLISLRVVYFPALLLALLATTAWSAWRGRNRASTSGAGLPSGRHSARMWGVAAVAFLCANLTYAVVNTQATHAHKLTTNVADMQFLAAALSPLGADQLEHTPLTAAERARLMPLTYKHRNAEAFAPNGLVPLILGHYTSTEAARPAMQRFVINVVIHHPVGVAGLVVREWSDYLNPAQVLSAHLQGWWSGAVAHKQPNELPDSVIQVFKDWKTRPTPTKDMPAKNSPSLWYFERVGGVWALMLAVAATLSIPAIFLIPSHRRSDFLIFSGLFSTIYMAEIALSSNEVITRYLMPISAPMIFMVTTIAISGVRARALKAYRALVAHRAAA